MLCIEWVCACGRGAGDAPLEMNQSRARSPQRSARDARFPATPAIASQASRAIAASSASTRSDEPCGMARAKAACIDSRSARVGQEVRELVAEARVEGLVLHETHALAQLARVAFLVAIGVVRIGRHEAGHAHRRDFGQGGGAPAAQDDRGGGEGRTHRVDVFELAIAGERLGALGELLRPGLVQDLHPRAG
jgi:hypothetical protein